MENASLVGLSRQIALSRELDVVANNIANLNTAGYKSDSTVFHEFLMPGVRANQFRGADRMVSFVHDRATWTDFSQGPVQPTGNPLDVAVSGNAFLTVQTPGGERYTKNGALQINSQGQLVTSEGLAPTAQRREVRARLNAAADIAFGPEPEEQLLRSALDLTYLQAGADPQSASRRLNVSRATFYRRLRLAIERLTRALAATP